MEWHTILFADYNIPYLFTVSFILLIGLLEVLAFTCGHMLSDVLDTHLDHYDSIAIGHISQALRYLNIGGLSVLVVLCLSTGFFGLIGTLLQHICIMAWQSPLSNLFAVPVSLSFTTIAVYYTDKIVASWIPRDHSSAITEEEYTGSMVLITGYQVILDNPCKGKLTGQFGQIHCSPLEPEEGKFLTKGNEVLVICRLSVMRYLAESNPWLQIL